MPKNPKTVDDNAPDKPVGVHSREKNVENDNARPKGVVVDTIVIHADAGTRAAGTVSWIEDDRSDVSYHSFVERDGDLHDFVEPERRAWHAGKSAYRGRVDVNDFSLGLAFANRNDGVEEYTEIQYQVGAAKAAQWLRLKERNGVQFAVTLERITDHATIALPPGRKTDPGPMFDMVKFKTYVEKTLNGIAPAEGS